MERIQFGTLSISSCPVNQYMEKFFESSEAPDAQIETKKQESFIQALENLQNGDLTYSRCQRDSYMANKWKCMRQIAKYMEQELLEHRIWY
jgi:hypothetical protein